MLSHISMSEGEAEAILLTIENLVKNNFDELAPFTTELKVPRVFNIFKSLLEVFGLRGRSELEQYQAVVQYVNIYLFHGCLPE